MKSPLRQSECGVALVLILTFLVLVTVVVLAFFFKVQFDRKVSSLYAASVQVDELGRGAMESVIGDLQAEIEAGSDPNVKTSEGLFRPRVAATIRPARWVSSAERTSLPTLVRRSMRSANRSNWKPAGFDADYGGATLDGLTGSEVSTTQPAQTGIFFPKDSWNRPHLMSMAGFADFQTPDWIYWTPQGATGAPADPSEVSGRFAFVLYDIGGLLNVNVAGYPSTGGSAPTAQELAGKGSIAYADLSRISGLPQAAVDALVAWRNAGSLAGSTFEDYMRVARADIGTEPGTLDGFLRVADGDERFLGRGDLVRYFEFLKDQSVVTNLDALPSLSVFHRSLNAPAIHPGPNASDLGGTSDAEFQYTSRAYDNNALNPDFLSVKVTTPFERMDGSDAVVGEPLVKRRFPLSRLAWLDSQSPTGGPASGADPAKILSAFGLKWVDNGLAAPDPGNSGRLYPSYWKYEPPGTNPSPMRIKTLDEVAASGREPNFFELLKAAILHGSLAGNQTAGGSWIGSYVTALDNDIDAHIFRLGANIIDQYDWGNYPTTIFAEVFPPADHVVYGQFQYFTGVENLPGLTRAMGSVWVRDATPADKNDDLYEQWSWIQPEIWNPHQNQGSSGNHQGPSNFRVVADGAITMFTNHSAFPNGRATAPTKFLNPTESQVEFDLSVTQWREPTVTEAFNSSTPNPLGTYDVDTSNMAYVKTFGFLPNRPSGIPVSGGQPPVILPGLPSSPLSGFLMDLPTTLSVQYRDDSGQWHTYNQMRRMPTLGNNGSSGMGPAPFTFLQKTDARTDRFTVTRSYLPRPWQNATQVNRTMRTGVDAGHAIYDGKPGIPPFTHPGADVRLGLISENKTSGSVYYADSDGVVRRADGAYANGTLDGLPMATGNTNSRPIILNRPFRNVAEMGAAFRDLPFKGLDFFTAESPDAALLDLFTMTEADMTADRINPNSAPREVLEALLAGTLLEPDSGTALTPTQASGLATAIRSTLDTTPITSPGDVAKVVTAAADVGAQLPTAAARIKNRREVISRSLAPVTDARTWNLLLDLVVQSGKIAPGSSSLENFIPSASRRYWIHIAIDRLTNRVLEIRTEPIHE